MTVPLQPPFGAAHAADLAVALAIGAAFGFVLERSGLASARKLVSQFYGSDMTVLKVLLSAIVTAMLGLVALAGAGAVDLSALAVSAASPSYVWPMIGGGLLLGAGLVVAGYCPGTSLVAAASGKIDGLAVVAGVLLGTLCYGEAMGSTSFARFARSGDLGQVFLPEILHLPWPLAAALVTAVAVGCFLAAEKLQRRFGGAAEAEGEVRAGRLVLAGLGALAAAAVVTLAFPASTMPGEGPLTGAERAASAGPLPADTSPAVGATAAGMGTTPKRRKRCEE